jgi:hypothetical protein
MILLPEKSKIPQLEINQSLNDKAKENYCLVCPHVYLCCFSLKFYDNTFQLEEIIQKMIQGRTAYSETLLCLAIL